MPSNDQPAASPSLPKAMPQERSWAALEWWGKWVYETCIAFGAGAHTAHGCAFHFTDGLRHEWVLGVHDA